MMMLMTTFSVDKPSLIKQMGNGDAIKCHKMHLRSSLGHPPKTELQVSNITKLHCQYQNLAVHAILIPISCPSGKEPH